MTRPTLYIVDGSGYVFRAFYAVRALTTASGTPTNAVYGFATMLQKLLRVYTPTYVAVAFDPPKPSFRKAMSADYKSHRPPTPPDLLPQLPLVRELTRALAVPALEVDGFEADDVIATLTVRARAAGCDVRIVSSDKDLCQLVDEHVRLLDTMRDKELGPAEVREKFGVEPEQIVELLGLAGDTSDNISGVPGIGDKTAAQLLQKYGTVEGVLAHIDEIPGEKRRENLRKHAEDARLSRRLAVLETDVPMPFDLEALRRVEADKQTLAAFFQRLEFSSLVRELGLDGFVPLEKAPSGAGSDDEPPLDPTRHRLVMARAELDEALAACAAAGTFAVQLVTTQVAPMRAHLVGLALAWGSPSHAIYVPVGHRYLGAPAQLSRDAVLEAARPLLQDPNVRKVGHDLKFADIVLRRLGVTLAGASEDAMLAGYLLDPGKPGFKLEEQSRDWLSHAAPTTQDLLGRGKNEVEIDTLDVDSVRRFACERADLALRLCRKLVPRVRAAEMGPLFDDVEMPLAFILSQMEARGVRVEPAVLGPLGRRMNDLIQAAEARIHDAAGYTLNINSPKQLQELLFGRLGLKATKKTQTGYSTDSDVLEALAADHPLPGLILEYRSVTKLKGTYVDALPLLIHPETGRIHTSYNQAVAATGRLSSSDPNLQNIPVRSELGREIRRAFVAAPGHRLVSADYSQIELRILAHASQDPTLISAFEAGEDIHARTAAEVFGVARDLVTPELRTSAKAINFGILYGMGAFRLSRELHIPTKQAQAYIDQYFARLPGIKRFVDATMEAATRDGFVRTMHGRRRFLPELASQNRNMRAQGERIAVNTPIQGSAADLIKIAMVRLETRLPEAGLRARMIMQVHDELVFEAPEDEVEAVMALARKEMESVAQLLVPLRVDVRSGKHWAEAH